MIAMGGLEIYGVRNAVREIDSLSSALRWTGGLSRRQPYSVEELNSLWHINIEYGYIDACKKL